MSHNPQAPEPFQFPKPHPPLTDNVHKLLENCRRRAREHGVTQFTGNADGLFGNELAVAMIADGKAVAPEINPDRHAEGMIEHYGLALGGALLGAECMRRVYDVLRPHTDRDVPKLICGHFGGMTQSGSEDLLMSKEIETEHVLGTVQSMRLLSQYGIRAVIHKELHQYDYLLPKVLYYLMQYQSGTAEELRLKFPLS